MKAKYTKRQITEAIAHWKKILESIDDVNEDELNEARGKGICDAFKTMYQDVAHLLQIEQDAEMEQWKQLRAAHEEKMADIKRRRAEAMANFQKTKAQLKSSGIDIDATDDLGDIAGAASEFTA